MKNKNGANLKIRLERLFIASVALFVAVAAAGCASKDGGHAKEAKNVRVASAALSTIEISVEYAAKVKPCQEVTVSAKVPGRVSEVKVDLGQRVEKGDVLFTLDPKDYEAQLRQAKAGLDTALANLTLTGDSSLAQQLLQADSALKQAQIQYDDAERLYNKTKELYDAGAVSKQQLDDIESKYRSARVQLDAAKERVSMLKEKVGPQSTGIASAQAEQARAQVEQANIQLDGTVITSPVSGKVSAKNIDVGELVSSAVPAVTLVDTTILYAEVAVPDKIVCKVRTGQTVQIKVKALEDRIFEGVIENVSPSADLRTQLYTVKIKLENPDDLIKPGMLAKILFNTEKRENVLVVPNGAILVDGGIRYVYTVADGKLRKVAVQTGVSNDKVTEIKSGLKEGDRVVLEGQSFLNEGEEVNIVE